MPLLSSLALLFLREYQQVAANHMVFPGVVSGDALPYPLTSFLLCMVPIINKTFSVFFEKNLRKRSKEADQAGSIHSGM